MKLVKIRIHNFKGIRDFETEFFGRTLISGRNAVGKTTIRDAIFWVLSDKMSDGTSASNIKPHDTNGNDIHHLETLVEIIIETDGVEIPFRKVLSEKWVKHRGENEATYEGDTTTYFVNGIEKSAKDFKTICSELFPEMALLYGSNAKTFLNLDAKKRRAILLDMISDETLDLLADPKWDDIRADLRFGTEDETILACKRQIKKHEDRITQEIAAIELLERDMEDTPKEDEIADQLLFSNRKLKKAQADEDAVRQKMDELSDKKKALLDLDNQIASEVHNANDESIRKRQEINAKILENQKKLLDAQVELKVAKSEADRLHSVYLQVAQKKLDAQKKEFDESTTICPVCGQKLPKAKVDNLKQTFATKVAELVEKCNKAMRDTSEQIEEEKSHCNVLETRIALLTEESGKLVDESQHLPSTDVEPTSDVYKALKRKRGTLLKTIEALELENLKDRLVVIRAEIDNARTAVNHFYNMQTKIESVSQMRIEIETHQQTIDEEREFIGDLLAKIDLIKQYQMAKVELLTEKINAHFSTIRWEMFKTHKDGSVELCCEPIVNGTSYYRGLNHGDRLLAEIDVCQAFQKASGCEMFVTLDDAESVDPDRIPKLKNQMLVFRRTDDETLSITEI